MEKKIVKIKDIPAIIWGKSCESLYLYVHGQGGNKEEAEYFAETVEKNGFQVLSFDLPKHGERLNEDKSFEPWNVIPELTMLMEFSQEYWKHISLFANSIGAWFSMLSFGKSSLESCLFISPVLDMKQLIIKMMSWANVTEDCLKQKQIIPTTFGQTLSWKYWKFVLAHPITTWNVPTSILYGKNDSLIEYESITQFANDFHCDLLIMEHGEHWFHTKEQIAFMCEWVKQKTS